MNDPHSLNSVFTSTSVIRSLASIANGRRQVRNTNTGKQKPYLHVGDSILWSPARKLRRLLSPLFTLIKPALRAFTSFNGRFCSFLFPTEILICDLQLGDRSPNLGAFKIPLPTISGLIVNKLYLSDDGSEIALVSHSNYIYVFSIHSNLWEPISTPSQHPKTAIHLHWSSEKLTIFLVTASREPDNSIYICILSRTRRSNDNISTTWNWKTSVSYGFFLMHSIDSIEEGEMDVLLDFHPESRTLAVLANWNFSSHLALIHLSTHPGGYLLPLHQLMHRKTHISSTLSEDFQQTISCMTWILSNIMPVIILMSKTGKLIAVTPAGRIWFPKEMPMMDPLERVNKVLPILDPAFSVSTEIGKGVFCITSGVDLDHRYWLLATDGHLLSSNVIEPSFEQFTVPKALIYPASYPLEWHDSIVFGVSTDTLVDILLGNIPEPLHLLLNWVDMIFLPCQLIHFSLAMDTMQKLLNQLVTFVPSRELLAIHVIRHTEKWLSLIFGEPFQWKQGWQSLALNLTSRIPTPNAVIEALYENAVLLGPRTIDTVEPLEDLEAICQYIQGGDSTTLFQSKYYCFLSSLHTNLTFAFELVKETFESHHEQTETNDTIRLTWIDVVIQLILSKEYQWTLPVYAPSILNEERLLEIDILFLQETYHLNPDLFSAESLFSVAARNVKHLLKLLSASNSWTFCWTTRLLFSLTFHDSMEAPPVIEDIMLHLFEEDNVKSIIFIGKVVQTASIVLHPYYTELLLDKLKRMIRSHLSLIPTSQTRYPKLQFLLTQSIFESDFPEFSFFITVLDWIHCCAYFSYSSTSLFYEFTRLLYALDLRIRLTENYSFSIAYLESSLALLHFDDLFNEKDLVSLAKTSLSRYPSHQWLEIIQSTCFDVSPHLISAILGSSELPPIPLSFSNAFSSDPRFLVFHDDICKVFEETLFTPKGTLSLYEIMQFHWQPELPPLVPTDGWLCVFQSTVSTSNTIPPTQSDELLEHVLISENEPDMGIESELLSSTSTLEPISVEEVSTEPLPITPENIIPIKPSMILTNPIDDSVSSPTWKLEEPKKEIRSFDSTTSPTLQPETIVLESFSTFTSAINQIQEDLKNLLLAEKHLQERPKVKKNKASTVSITKRKQSAATQIEKLRLTRSPSFEKFLSDRTWKQKESDLLSSHKAFLKKKFCNPTHSRDLLRLTLLHSTK